MIKHNLPLVRGGSLWQYRSVPPQLQLWRPHCPPPNVNLRTATEHTHIVLEGGVDLRDHTEPGRQLRPQFNLIRWTFTETSRTTTVSAHNQWSCNSWLANRQILQTKKNTCIETYTTTRCLSLRSWLLGHRGYGLRPCLKKTSFALLWYLVASFILQFMSSALGWANNTKRFNGDGGCGR